MSSCKKKFMARVGNKRNPRIISENEWKYAIKSQNKGEQFDSSIVVHDVWEIPCDVNADMGRKLIKMNKAKEIVKKGKYLL